MTADTTTNPATNPATDTTTDTTTDSTTDTTTDTTADTTADSTTDTAIGTTTGHNDWWPTGYKLGGAHRRHNVQSNAHRRISDGKTLRVIGQKERRRN
jgi:hypothetical protein